jgi:hypothetical protein
MAPEAGADRPRGLNAANPAATQHIRALPARAARPNLRYLATDPSPRMVVAETDTAIGRLGYRPFRRIVQAFHCASYGRATSPPYVTHVIA